MLTIILAVKDANVKQLYGCISSIAALKNSSHIDLMIVSSGALPELLKEQTRFLNKITIIDAEPLGVYSAFNRGIDEKPNGYILFIGVDDLVLPGLDRVIDFILSVDDRPEVIAASAYRQDIGLAVPSQIRASLIARNWCQQGLLYHSRLFENKRFDITYVVRADHKFNLELAGDRQNKIAYRPDVITHFSAGGLSSQVEDRKFITDMPAVVRRSYGLLFWLIALVIREVKWPGRQR